MNEYNEEKDGKQVTLWNETEGVGLRFMEGEPLQRYKAAVEVRDTARLTTKEGIKGINTLVEELNKEAERKYPNEFAPLSD